MSKKALSELLKLIQDNDQDRSNAMTWIKEDFEENQGQGVVQLWDAIQKMPDDGSTQELISRFAQLALGDAMEKYVRERGML